MRKDGQKDRDGGFALPLTMVILAILCFLAATLVRNARLDVESVRIAKKSFLNTLANRDVLEQTKLCLLTGTVDGRLSVPCPENNVTLYFDHRPLPASDVSTLRIQDHSGLLPLSLYSTEKLKSLFFSLTGDEQQAIAIAGAYIDWLDIDGERSYLGAERGDYRGDVSAGRIRNGPFRSIGEIMEVRGINEEYYLGDPLKKQPGLKDIFTMVNPGYFNPALAPALALAAHPLLRPYREQIKTAGMNGDMDQLRKMLEELGARHPDYSLSLSGVLTLEATTDTFTTREVIGLTPTGPTPCIVFNDRSTLFPMD